MHLPNNTHLQGGKYRIIRFISSGGFGCTYEAVHVLLGKRVAIKEFFVKDFCNRDETTSHVTVGTQTKVALVSKLKRKFIEEASALGRFNHPNIVHVSDVFEENGTAYYVMDFIDGKSINEILKTQSTIPESKAVKYILQVAEALKKVHAQNRLHLDIKPGNIMIDSNDNAVLIDFGASKQYDEEAGENTSTLVGRTPGYAPLEQLGNDIVKFFPATDIYALGATLYKMLSGKTPLSATLLASGEELEPLPSYITKPIKDAVFKAMATNKKMRPQNIDEFLSILTNGCLNESENSSSSQASSDGDEEETSFDPIDNPRMHSSGRVERSGGSEDKKQKANNDGQGSTSSPFGFKEYRNKKHQKNKKLLIGSLVILSIIVCALLVINLSHSFNNEKTGVDNIKLETYNDSISYALGVFQAEDLESYWSKGFGLDSLVMVYDIIRENGLNFDYLEKEFSCDISSNNEEFKNGYKDALQDLENGVVLDTAYLSLPEMVKRFEYNNKVYGIGYSVAYDVAMNRYNWFNHLNNGSINLDGLLMAKGYINKLNNEYMAIPFEECIEYVEKFAHQTFENNKVNINQNSSTAQPTINEEESLSPNDKMMLGTHLFSLQWISWDRFGKVTITKGSNENTYFIKGKQDGKVCSDNEEGRQNGDFVSINGTITVVSKTKLIFNGIIITKVYHLNGGQECVREGQFTFESYGGRRYWRMQEMLNPCDEVTDYVDIYFN